MFILMSEDPKASNFLTSGGHEFSYRAVKKFENIVCESCPYFRIYVCKFAGGREVIGDDVSEKTLTNESNAQGLRGASEVFQLHS
jgi:hypothetical protein